MGPGRGALQSAASHSRQCSAAAAAAAKVEETNGQEREITEV